MSLIVFRPLQFSASKRLARITCDPIKWDLLYLNDTAKINDHPVQLFAKC